MAAYDSEKAIGRDDSSEDIAGKSITRAFTSVDETRCVSADRPLADVLATPCPMTSCPRA